MGEALKRPVTGVVVVVVVAAVAYAGWKWGHALVPRMEERPGIGQAEADGPPVTPETAARASAKIAEFRDSKDVELSLESWEVSSLLRYRTPGILPAGVLEPGVAFAGDRIEVSARVLPADIPDLPRLGGIRGLLPDTVDVLVVGSLLPSDEKGTLLLVESAELQGWPVPEGSLPEILAALGRQPPPGAPASAVLIPSWGGLKGAYIEDGRLVLVRARRSVDDAAPGAEKREARSRQGAARGRRPENNAERSREGAMRMVNMTSRKPAFAVWRGDRSGPARMHRRSNAGGGLSTGC